MDVLVEIGQELVHIIRLAVTIASLEVLGVRRRTLLYISVLRDMLDLTGQNDVICNCTQVVMFSMYLNWVLDRFRQNIYNESNLNH